MSMTSPRSAAICPIASKARSIVSFVSSAGTAAPEDLTAFLPVSEGRQGENDCLAWRNWMTVRAGRPHGATRLRSLRKLRGVVETAEARAARGGNRNAGPGFPPACAGVHPGYAHR